MAAGIEEAGIVKTVLGWAWAGVGVLMGIIWKRHNEEIAGIKASIEKVGSDMNENVKFLDGRIDAVERSTVPLERYEQNRKEVREGQVETFRRLDNIGQALARIEGKLEK